MGHRLEGQRSLNGTTPSGQQVQDVEGLERVVRGDARREQATPEDPARASADDLEALQRIHALGPLGRFASLRNRGSIGRLTREGLLTLDGALDAAGEDFMRPVSTAHDVLAVRGRYGRQRTLLQAWLSGAEASVVSGPAGSDLLAAADGSDRPQYAALSVDRGSLASLVCDWAGVRTFPAALTEDLLLPETTFTRRVLNGCMPVPDPSEFARPGGAAEGESSDDGTALDPEALAGWWGEPWFVWEVTSVRLGVNLGLISAHGAGNYVFGSDTAASERCEQPMVRVAPATAQAVWEALWLLTHGGGEDGAAGKPVLQGTPRRGPLGTVPALPRNP